MKSNSPIALYFVISVIGLVALRFILMDAMPLLDKTEARYAEIARLMVETDNWLVPHIDYDVPFWAKPPLSTWFSAIGIKLFGANELAVRLPSFLLHIVLLIGLGFWAKSKGFSPYLLAFVLLTTPEFLIHTGVVSTDSALLACVAVAMLAFWEATQNNPRPFWKHLFFLALGLGLLAKGPIMLVLTLPPILLWMALHRINLFEQLKKLQWWPGIILSAIIAVPWYVMAELRSPGFLDYFLIGEHFKRFVDSSWQGDMYGAPKRQAVGTIWLFMFVFAFPWVQYLFIGLWKKGKSVVADKWLSFLLLWFLWAPLFFTFSSNILHTYILPSMVPMSLLVLDIGRNKLETKKWVAIGSFFPLLVVGATLVFMTYDPVKNYLNTDKYLLNNKYVSSEEKHIPTIYWRRKSYSGQFYAQKQLKLVEDLKGLDSIVRDEGKIFVVVANKMRQELSTRYQAHIQLIDSNYKTTLYLLKNEDFF